MSRRSAPPVRALHGHGFSPFTDEHEASRIAKAHIRDDVSRFSAQLRAAEALKMRMVYGALRRERPLVKIGTSFRLTGHDGRIKRMKGSTLVALTLGGYDVERQVHERLARHRVWADLPGEGFGEHFTLCADVLGWINETRHAVGLEVLDLRRLMSHYV